jgi:hypothetical protein
MRQKEITQFLESAPIEWLLSGDSFVKYRTLADILGVPQNDKEVVETKALIRQHPEINRVFRNQNRYGYWGRPKDIYAWWPRKDTTFWILGMLADFGLARDDKRIASACEYVFRTQLPSGAFGWAPPPTPGDCFTGFLAESLAKLGYSGDPRLKRTYDWLLQRQRLDGGFWCKNTGQPGKSRAHEPSCALATLCVLGALAQSPRLRNGQIARKATGFLLECWENRGRVKYAGHDSQIGKGWEKLKYPFTDYRLLKYLDVLSQVRSCRNDPRIDAITDVLVAKQDEVGRFYPESIHEVWSGFDFGQKGLPSRWLTFLVYRIAKRLSLER